MLLCWIASPSTVAQSRTRIAAAGACLRSALRVNRCQRCPQLTTLWDAFTDQSVLPGSLRFGGAKYILIAGDPGSVIRGKLSQVGSSRLISIVHLLCIQGGNDRLHAWMGNPRTHEVPCGASNTAVQGSYFNKAKLACKLLGMAELLLDFPL